MPTETMAMVPGRERLLARGGSASSGRCPVSWRPSMACGGCTPTPRKLKPDSATMAPPKPKVTSTIRGPSAFGIRCFSKIFFWLTPIARAASTNSLFAQRKNLSSDQAGVGGPLDQ